MKKLPVILLISLQLITLFSFGQKAGNKNKKQRFCLIKITLMNDSVDKYALSRFSNDTIYVFPLVKKQNNNEIQTQRETSFKAENIRRIYVGTEKGKINTDSIEQTSFMISPPDDPITLALIIANSKAALISYSLNQILYPRIPMTNLVLLGLGPVITGNKASFDINGKKEYFDRMVNQLLGTKDTVIKNSEKTNW